MLIVVPYRNRKQHLGTFTRHWANFMPDAEILIVEQIEGKPFNRAKLLNIGFLESDSDYYVFSDIDMLPLENVFQPCEVAHLAGRASQFKYKLPYPTYFGGVNMFSKEAFLKVNGYCNDFWGWGSEDDEMYNNVSKIYQIEYRAGRFRSLAHNPADRSYHNKNILLNLAGRTSGLSDCDYKVERRIEQGYKMITVCI